MGHITCEESSRKAWGISNESTTDINQLKFGAMQRIANATELMAKNYSILISDRNMYERLYRSECIANKRMANQIRGLKAAITRMKKSSKK